MSDTLDHFIDETPLLSKVAQEHLLAVVAAGQDPASARQVRRAAAAKQTLVERNLRLVKRIVARYVKAGGSLDYDDLMQEGTIGLMHAIEMFDASRRVPFSHYAARWIAHYIDRAIVNTGRTIRLPINVDQAVRSMRSVRSLLSQDLGRDPTPEEIADEMGVTARRVLELLLLDQPMVSITTDEGDMDFAAMPVDFDEFVDEFDDETREPGPGEKRCSRCRQVKLVAEFYRNRTREDGLQSQCKPCMREIQQKAA